MKRYLFPYFGLMIIAGGLLSTAAADGNRPFFENDRLKLLAIPRTPNQMAGFYEARGFPQKMIDVLTDYCFMTVIVHNKTKNEIWLNMDNWKFISRSGEVKRIHRQQWHSRWKEMKIPMAFQSTFRWTLLPETLELFPDEQEGGNVVLVQNDNTISLQADFAVGKDASEGNIAALINNLRCAKNSKNSFEGTTKP